MYNFAFMNRKRKWWIVLGVLAIVIRIVASFPAVIEKYYSAGLYPVIAALQRFLFGWIPFSVGDLLYAIAAICLLVKGYRFFKTIFQKKADTFFWKRCLSWLLIRLLFVY